MARAHPEPPLSVSLLALPETTPATLYCLYEVLNAAAVAWSDYTGEPATGRRIEARIVSADGADFRSLLGPPIAPQATLSGVPRSDVVVVTDLQIALDSPPRGRWPAEAAWARTQYRDGALLCSVCTGSLFLAEAGLLEGEEATTHWLAAGLFAAAYPGVRLRPERILLTSGPEQRLVTTGGAASWEELALYLVTRFCGQQEAVRLAKLFVLGDRSDGQLPYAALAQPRWHEDGVVARCQQWIADNYAAPSPVARMIEQSGLSERTFKRRFKAATGYAPIDYVQALRIEEAKQLLETTAEATESVAALVGYEDPTFFRRLFKRCTGVTPARYRQRFRVLLPRLAAG